MIQLRGNSEVIEIAVEVSDENDNSPAFDRHIYQGSVRRGDLNAGRAVRVDLGHRVRVTDPDLGDEIAMKLLGKASDRFRLDAASGRVYLNSYPAVAGSFAAAPAVSKADDKFYLRIRATDRAGHITESQLVVHVKDGGDEEEVIEEEKEEEVTTTRPAPVFAKRRTTVTTTSTSTTTTNKTTTKRTTTTTTRKLINPPKFRGLAVIDAAYVTLKGRDDLSVVETAPVGTRLARVMVTDEEERLTSGSGSKFRLKFAVEDEEVHNLRSPKRHIVERKDDDTADLDGGKGHFKIEPSSGDIILFRKLSPALKYLLNVSVTDESALRTHVTLKIGVEDVNDNRPHFDRAEYGFQIDEGTYNKQRIGQTFATDGDVGINGKVSCNTSKPRLEGYKR